MPLFRDARGRFVSESVWNALFGTPDVDEDETEQYAEPNWYETESERGLVWTTGDPRNPLDPAALADMQPPEGYASFQIRFSVPDNPTYPRGYASYDALAMTEWPPDPEWGRSIGATGIGAIIFSRY